MVARAVGMEDLREIGDAVAQDDVLTYQEAYFDYSFGPIVEGEICPNAPVLGLDSFLYAETLLNVFGNALLDCLWW